MNSQVFAEYHEFVVDAFAAFLPLLVLFVSVSLAFSIAHQLRHFIVRIVRGSR